jgi:hypothetical protein
MPDKPHIPHQQFIQKYASEFYLTEHKRKAYYPKIISTTVGTFALMTTAIVMALNLSKPIGQWLFVSTAFILLGGMILGIYFWNQFRVLHKESVLKMLIQEYFPQLSFSYLPKEYPPSGFYQPSNYLNELGYWPAYQKFILNAQDFIEGPIGNLEIKLFEARIQHRDSSGNSHPLFDGIMLEIQKVPTSARLEEIESRAKIQKALNDIFQYYKKDNPKLFASPNGNWYLFLEHSNTYLEPKGIKKTWSEEELERLLSEFYYFIRFAEVLEAELSEYKALPSGEE